MFFINNIKSLSHFSEKIFLQKWALNCVVWYTNQFLHRNITKFSLFIGWMHGKIKKLTFKRLIYGNFWGPEVVGSTLYQNDIGAELTQLYRSSLYILIDRCNPPPYYIWRTEEICTYLHNWIKILIRSLKSTYHTFDAVKPLLKLCLHFRFAILILRSPN